MLLKPEQLFAAQKANVESLLDLTSKAFEGLEKLVDLNMQVAKASLGDSSDAVTAVLSVRDAQDLAALQNSLLQPAAEKAAAYSRQLYEIVAATGAAVSKYSETQASDAQKKFAEAMESALKNAPAGTESAVSLIKSALASANNAYDNANKAVKQAAEVAEANFQTLAANATPGAKTAKAKR